MSSNVEGSPDAQENRDLLRRVAVVDERGRVHRSNPLSDPAAFHELARRLQQLIDRRFDLVVVRDLFGDRVLGYELGLLAGCPVAVSYDREGLIEVDLAGVQGHRAVIAADTHFTKESITAAAMGLRRSGLEISGAAVLLEQLAAKYDFPVWSLEHADVGS